MTKPIKNKSLFYLCSDLVKHTQKNYRLPEKLSYDGVTYYILEYVYLVSYGVYHLKSDFTIPNFKWVSNEGEDVTIRATEQEYKDAAKRVYNFIVKNSKVPTYVTIKGKKVPIKLYTYAMATVIQYYNNHKQLPESCVFDYKIFHRPEPTPTKTYPEKVYDWFCETFNCKPTCFDDCLEYIDGKGYGYYYDDQFTNKESIQRMKKGNGVNCTDACHVFYNLAKYFIQKGKYRKVQCIHVMCRGGDGHVRLRIQLNDGDYFYRDPASVLDGNGIESNWCMNGTVVAYDPGWFMANLER